MQTWLTVKVLFPLVVLYFKTFRQVGAHGIGAVRGGPGGENSAAPGIGVGFSFNNEIVKLVYIKHDDLEAGVASCQLVHRLS